jgi:hypothetical protein
MKNRMPIPDRTATGIRISAKPAPSINMLLIPSANRVSGKSWITGRLQSGKL